MPQAAVTERPVTEALRVKWRAFIKDFLIASVVSGSGYAVSKGGLPGTIAGLLGAWNVVCALETEEDPLGLTPVDAERLVRLVYPVK